MCQYTINGHVSYNKSDNTDLPVAHQLLLWHTGMTCNVSLYYHRILTYLNVQVNNKLNLYFSMFISSPSFICMVKKINLLISTWLWTNLNIYTIAELQRLYPGWITIYKFTSVTNEWSTSLQHHFIPIYVSEESQWPIYVSAGPQSTPFTYMQSQSIHLYLCWITAYSYLHIT